MTTKAKPFFPSDIPLYERLRLKPPLEAAEPPPVETPRYDPWSDRRMKFANRKLLELEAKNEAKRLLSRAVQRSGKYKPVQ